MKKSRKNELKDQKKVLAQKTRLTRALLLDSPLRLLRLELLQLLAILCPSRFNLLGMLLVRLIPVLQIIVRHIDRFLLSL